MRDVSSDQNDGSDVATELGALLGAHLELEERLKHLDGHVYLTPDEQLERKQIQKKKLLLKDRIRAMESD
jgi:hypothetical protein